MPKTFLLKEEGNADHKDDFPWENGKITELIRSTCANDLNRKSNPSTHYTGISFLIRKTF